MDTIKSFIVLIYLTTITFFSSGQSEHKFVLFGREYKFGFCLIAFSPDSSKVGVLLDYNRNVIFKIITEKKDTQIFLNFKSYEFTTGTISISNDSRFVVMRAYNKMAVQKFYVCEFHNSNGELVIADSIISVKLNGDFLQNGDFYLNYISTHYSFLMSNTLENRKWIDKLKIFDKKYQTVINKDFDSAEKELIYPPVYADGKITIQYKAKGRKHKVSKIGKLEYNRN